MRQSSMLGTFILFLLILSSCGGSDGDSGSNGQQREEAPPSTGGTSGAGITFDSELSPSERAALDSSTRALAGMNINGSASSWFSKIFGGNRSSNVVNYVDTRINYAISESTDYRSRFFGESARFNMLETIAVNYSVLIWLEGKISEPNELKYRINDKSIDINSTRIGVMQFGSGFVKRRDASRAMTIVHEARHSDCTGGTWRSDIVRWQDGQLPLNAKCAHLHELCPPGNPYRGTQSCDFEPWGAYIIQAFYAAAIIETCTNCTVADIQDADVDLNDALIKIMDLESHLNGSFGSPDMSSSPQIREGQ